MRPWRKISYIGVPIMLVALFAGFYIWANQPVSVAPQVQSVSTERSQRPVLQVISGETFSFDANEIYRIREQIKNGRAPLIESLVATQTSQGSGRLAVTVATLPVGGIGEVPDVRWRREQPTTYQERQIQTKHGEIPVFVSGASSEIAAFLPASDRYAAVVISNSMISPSQTTSEEVTAIIDSWRWRDGGADGYGTDTVQ